MSETKRVYNLVIDGSVVFGPADTFPKVSEFHAIIVANRSRLTRDSLAAVAYQTACQAPHKFLSLYLNKLICIFWSDETSALTQLADSAAGSKVCGRIFKRGEIVWTCKQCGLDPTCVQCDQCYRSSDHIGHDVYFHKSGAGGGCCDCGDSEAWKAEGNCPHHGEKSAAGKDSSKIEDPITELPEPLVEGASAVLLGTVLMLVNFTIMSVRGFEPFDKNVYVAKASDESLCLRLFNDDFHSYIEVNEALRQCGLSESACNSTTRLVDKTGFAKISSETFDKLRPIYEKLRPQLHLLVSIVPDSLVTMEPTINSLLNWFQELAAFHDGLRRIVANILITRIDQIAPSAVDAIRACSYIDGVRCAFLDPFDDVMTFRQQFPLIVPVVDCRTTPRGRQPPLVFESSDIISLGSNVLTKHPEICVPMAVLVAASHFLTQPLQKSLNELLIGGLRDEIFRRAFTQVLTMLYPTLHKQFCVGLGTAERSVLQDTCQVYTAYSLSMMMSSVGLAQRVLQPAEASSNPPIHISTVLMQSAVQCIRLGGIAQSTCSNTVVKGYEHSHVLSHHRFRQSLRDFGYVMKCPGFGLGVLCGDLDPETVDVFLIYCKELSGMDGYKCIRSGAHIEQEDVNWQSAVEVALELENTSTEFLDDAFFPQHIQNLTETALILKKKEALKFLVTKTIAVLHERWENDCLRMTKFFDGQSLISTGPSTAVSARMVSIHNTLEKFLAKCIVTAARSGLIFSLRDFNGVFGFMLAEAALRSFSFVAQVKGQIWIRNGIAPFNIAHNYDFPPVCLMFRDVDLHVLQIALHEYKNKDVFLSTVRCIFELTQNPFGDLNAEQFSSVSVFTENSCIHLASELLRMLILLMSQLPVDLVSNGCAGLRWILKKEIVHAILSGARSRSELQKVKAFVNCPEAILTEQFLQSAISELCEDSLESSDGGPGKLFIKPQFALDFDPEHSHLMPKKQQASFDSANEVRKSLKRDIDKYKGILPTTPWPVISRSSVSSPHKAFGSTRSLLYCKSFADFMKYLVVSILPDASSQTLKAGGQIIIARVIHLITLQLHSQTETASYVRQLHSMPEYEGDSEHHKEVLSFELSVSQQDGGMFSLLETLADVFAKGLIAADEFYHDGLLYVLSEYAKQSAHIREMCKSKGIGLTGLSATTDIHTSASDSLKRRRDEAMSRAMTTMRKRAAQFFQANDMTLPMALSKALTLVESDTTAGDGYDDIEGSTVCKEVLDIEGDEVICIVCRY